MSNWINLEIAGKKYYLLCKISEKDDWDCLLYDGNESWYEKQVSESIFARAKELNRRIQYDEATIKETLQSGQPTESRLEDDAIDDEEQTNKRLKLKYNVKSCPFHFTWHLSKQSEHDFQKFILFPLFRIVQGLTQQNKELREVVRKKDVEIKQYKYEFGNLTRATVATKPFDSANFDERFAETLELSKCMMQISDLLKAQYSQIRTPLKGKVVDKVDNIVDAKNKRDVKLTPRRKRRKVIEEQQRVIVEKIQAINKPFAYESSQSQISSISQSDTEYPGTSRRLLRSPKKNVEPKIENDLDETPTKRNRTQKPVREQTTIKSAKRNLNAGIEYDDSSDDETKSTKLLTAEKANNEDRASCSTVQNTSNKLSKNTVDIEADVNAAFSKNNAGISDYNDGTDDEKKPAKSSDKNLSQVAKQANKTEQANKAKASLSSLRPSSSNVSKSPVMSGKSSPAIAAVTAGRQTRKNAGIEYEDSSESPAEEKSYHKSSPSLNATVTNNSSSKTTQSPEQLSDDVQNLIDEWKALEKRRLADLKIRRK